MRNLRPRPLTVRLRTDQYAALRAMARKEHVSVNALVSRALDQMLSLVPIEQDSLMSLVGFGSSGLHDVAENHDKYLVEYYRGKTRIDKSA